MKFKKLLSFVLILCLFIGTLQFPVSAATLDNGIMYVIQNGEAIISNYVGNDTEVVIPAEIKGYPVTTIGKEAFYRKEFIEKVTLPETVKAIGIRSFANCSSLTDINIPKAVEQICGEAFYECKSLKNVYIPNSVKSIDADSFSGCSSLEEVVIPDSVKKIEVRAFYGCTSLKKVVLPNSIKKLTFRIFAMCTSLEKINIPDSVKEIDNEVFCGCKSLKSITIPKTITCLFGLGGTYFEDFEIPDSVTTIGQDAFGGSKMESLYLPPSVECIESSAFGGSKLKRIKIANPNCQLKAHSFAETRELCNIVLPSSVRTIEDYTFYHSSIRTITIPASVKSISPTAFELCKNLVAIFYKGTPEQWKTIARGIPKSTAVCFLNDESKAEEQPDMFESVRTEFLKKHMLLSWIL